MKVITRGVIDWETGNVLEEDAYEYCGPVSAAKSSGNSPQPTNPYEQAAAQYGLATGTANYNAALDRTNSFNPLGSNTWSVTGQDGSGDSTFGGFPTGFGQQNSGIPGFSFGGAAPSGSFGTPATPTSSGGTGVPGWGGGSVGTSAPFGMGGSGIPVSMGGAPAMSQPNGTNNGGSGAPIYTQETSLSPWANQLLESPIDTQGMPGMPGGPSEQQNVNDAENATFNQQMSLLQPQEQLQSEQNQSQLEAEGAMPGSAAYDYGTQELGRVQGAQNAQVANSAVTTGMGELPMLYGLGSTSLQNQLAERNAPISEYEALQGNPSANVSAATPDISGAFNQQFQGQLAGYNANTATNNANTQAGAGLGTAALMAYAELGSAF